MARPTVSVRRTTATVTWRPAVANGSPVTGYTVLVSGERSRTVPATKRKVVVKGISRGRHTVRVTATNAVGTSPPSAVTKIRVR
ncbi:fibronectin type III domain-containing protein [Nocardioides sp. AX2bis]|uniref:fibronectin type III domain-containing protein n=1 Tax=Nocardioides sp. AX2bis TaxID=2653157 RepID=UPI001F46A7E6|nr:fibronectin type III domain-containing protein [Nocardioides sp. AX2bis]